MPSRNFRRCVFLAGATAAFVTSSYFAVWHYIPCAATTTDVTKTLHDNPQQSPADYRKNDIVFVTASAPHNPHFDWTDIDFSVKASCGVHKCFWPSVSHSNTIGYVIAPEPVAEGILRAQLLMQRLDRVCNNTRRTLYLDDKTTVQLVPVSRQRMQQLDALTFNPSREMVGQKTPQVFSLEDDFVAVHKVQRAPKHTLLYGTWGTKWDALLNEAPRFLRNHVKDYTNFRKQLLRERQAAECALHAERNMWVDFQALIDAKGRVFLMDQDAKFYRRPVDQEEESHRVNKTLRHLDEFIAYMDKVQEQQR